MRFSRQILFFVAELLFNKFCRFYFCGGKKKIEANLVCYSGRIGDFIVALPYLAKYQEHLSNVVYLFPEAVKPMANCVFSRALFYNPKKISFDFFYRFKLLGVLSKYSMVKAISVASFSQFNFILGVSAQEHICYEGEFEYGSLPTRLRRKLYTRVIANPFIFGRERKHISLHNCVIFKGVTGEDYLPSADEYKTRLQVFSDKQHCLKFNLRPNQYIVFIVDALFMFRSYPENLWQAVLDSIDVTLPIVLIGSRKVELYHPRIISLVGDTTLLEAFSLISNATLVVGGETGPIHFSYLSGVSTVCLLGGGHFGRFLPWDKFESVVYCLHKEMSCFGCNWSCSYPPLANGVVPCVGAIEPNLIAEIIMRKLEEFAGE